MHITDIPASPVASTSSWFHITYDIYSFFKPHQLHAFRS